MGRTTARYQVGRRVAILAAGRSGQHGESIPLVWNTAIAFQQFQRYATVARGSSPISRGMRRRVATRSRSTGMTRCSTSVGRYHGSGGAAAGEWLRIERLRRSQPTRAALIRRRPPWSWPARRRPAAAARPPIRRQSRSRESNLTRWAVTGRDDIGINTACWRCAGGRPATDAQWQELCELWSSDYRTHITDALAGVSTAGRDERRREHERTPSPRGPLGPRDGRSSRSSMTASRSSSVRRGLAFPALVRRLAATRSAARCAWL